MTFWVSIQKSESFCKSLTPWFFMRDVQYYSLEIFTLFKVNKLIFTGWWIFTRDRNNFIRKVNRRFRILPYTGLPLSFWHQCNFIFMANLHEYQNVLKSIQPYITVKVDLKNTIPLPDCWLRRFSTVNLLGQKPWDTKHRFTADMVFLIWNFHNFNACMIEKKPQLNCLLVYVLE